MKQFGRVPDARTPSGSDPKRIKICHLAATDHGATWMYEQLRDLRDRYNYEVVAVVSGPQGRLIDKLKSDNIRYQVINFATGPGPFTETLMMPFAILKLACFFRRERFDAIQHHIFITMRVARPAAWLADVPIRISMISGPFHLQAPSSRWLERFTHWMDTFLIPSCRETLALCQQIGVAEDKLGPVIYYGPDERRFNPETISPLNLRAQFGWPPGTPVICMVAFFYPRLSNGPWVPAEVRGRGIKGHGDLVRAVPAVLQEFPDAKFLLVGSGWGVEGEKYLDEVKQLVCDMRLESTVLFPGFQDDANRILREADVAIQASLNENLGGTIESLLMECPTIATRVGGLIDTVREDETGVLVNPSDPEDLARGIKELLRNPEKAKAMAKAGRRLMLEQFTLKQTVCDLNSVYVKLSERVSKQRKPYKLMVSLGRLLISVPLFALIALRLFLVDGYLFYKVRKALSALGRNKRNAPSQTRSSRIAGL